jgi:hypothetical protein
MTTQRSGSPSIPPELLARMTPEQQATLEARMKTKESQGPQTTVRKQCLTKEDLQKPLNFGDDRGSCQRTVVSASSSMKIHTTGTGKWVSADEAVSLADEAALWKPSTP